MLQHTVRALRDFYDTSLLARYWPYVISTTLRYWPYAISTYETVFVRTLRDFYIT